MNGMFEQNREAAESAQPNRPMTPALRKSPLLARPPPPPLLPQDCPKHGTEFLEWKCRFCCSVAVWYCFGTTHFCDKCHQIPGEMTGKSKEDLPKCPAAPQGKPLTGATECPLKLRHPPAGEEFALGCGQCRNAREF